MRRMSLFNGLLGVLLALGAGCRSREQGSSETIAQIQAREGIPVTVEAAQQGHFQVVENQGGTVQGYNQTELGAPIPAKITSVNVKVGQWVKENEVLITLDQESMASAYREAKAQLDQVERSYDRIKALADEGGVSQDALQQVETGLTVARSQFDKVNKMVNILAPFDGTIVALNAKVNDQAKPGGGQNGPPPLAVIARLDRVTVDMEVNEATVNQYRPGQPAFTVMEGDTIRGTITEVAISGGDKSHSFPIRAVFANRGLVLKPGMYVTVSTVVYQDKTAVTIPTEAVRTGPAGSFVYVVENNQAAQRGVILGRRGTGRYQVESGLNGNEPVIVTGISQVSDRVKVKVIH